MNDIKGKYTCDACRYTFESDKLPERCPDCGKMQVRPANETEIYDYDYRFDNEIIRKNSGSLNRCFAYYFIVGGCGHISWIFFNC